MMRRLSQPLAWSLIVLTTGFWLWFGASSASSERLGPINAVFHLLVPGGAFLVIARPNRP
jgi:predicted membrane channel-forming protein YqfA (hemolysin III family)